MIFREKPKFNVDAELTIKKEYFGGLLLQDDG